MSSDYAFRIRYWGVTGSFATPLTPRDVQAKVVGSLRALLDNAPPEALRRGLPGAELESLIERHVPYWQRSTFGGNTTCVEVSTPEGLFILDMGSGARELGRHLNRRWNSAAYTGPRTAHVLISHPHLDHTFATPLVEPLYDERNRFHVRAPASVLDSLEAILGDGAPMREVYFPTTYQMMRGLASLQPVHAGDCWEVEGTRISTLALNHPGGCLAYKLERDSRSFVFASDHEHAQGPDRSLAEFAAGADLLYADAQYLEAEYRGERGVRDEAGFSKAGWGHSTVEAVIETALAAGVRQLHLGHHDPHHSDEQLAEIERYARDYAVRRQASSNNCQIAVAREGLICQL